MRFNSYSIISAADGRGICIKPNNGDADLEICISHREPEKITVTVYDAVQGDFKVSQYATEKEEINSEDLKCNTCGDYVGEEGVWGLCETCFDKEGGNEAIEYVYKPLSKEALAEVAQLEPRYMQHTTEKKE